MVAPIREKLFQYKYKGEIVTPGEKQTHFLNTLSCIETQLALLDCGFKLNLKRGGGWNNVKKQHCEALCPNLLVAPLLTRRSGLNVSRSSSPISLPSQLMMILMLNVNQDWYLKTKPWHSRGWTWDPGDERFSTNSFYFFQKVDHWTLLHTFQQYQHKVLVFF